MAGQSALQTVEREAEDTAPIRGATLTLEEILTPNANLAEILD